MISLLGISAAGRLAGMSSKPPPIPSSHDTSVILPVALCMALMVGIGVCIAVEWIEATGKAATSEYEQAKATYDAAVASLAILEARYEVDKRLLDRREAESAELNTDDEEKLAAKWRAIRAQKHAVEEARSAMVGAWNRENPGTPMTTP